MRTRILIIMNILFLLAIVSFTGCSPGEDKPIVTIDDTKLTKEDFLYEIWLVEYEGDQLEEYYQKNLKCSYWDSSYQGSTIRELAKNAIIAGVVMHEILWDQAKNKGVVLTKEELAKNQKQLEDIYHNHPVKELKRAGLTKELIKRSLDKIALAEKYKQILCSDIIIDEKVIRKSFDRKDYSTDNQYEKAVSEAIDDEINKQFEPVYQKIKVKYKITIDFDYWDSISIGSKK